MRQLSRARRVPGALLRQLRLRLRRAVLGADDLRAKPRHLVLGVLQRVHLRAMFLLGDARRQLGEMRALRLSRLVQRLLRLRELLLEPGDGALEIRLGLLQTRRLALGELRGALGGVEVRARLRRLPSKFHRRRLGVAVCARLGGVALRTLQRLHELADASLRRLRRGGGRLRLGARGGGVLLGRRELTGGDERVGLGLEEFLESRLQASVGLGQRGVFGAGHAQVQLALAPRRAKLRLGGASFVERQAFLRRAGHLLRVQLEFLLLLSRLRLLGDGGLERLRQAHLANLQHGQRECAAASASFRPLSAPGLSRSASVCASFASTRFASASDSARRARSCSAARSATQPALARTCSRYSADRVDPISVIACLYLATSDTSCSS